MSRAVYRSRRAEVMALRAELFEAGATVPQIATAIRRRFGVNSRIAFRWACGLTQQQVADQWNQLWPSDRPRTDKQVWFWETWPAPNGRMPSIEDLSRLASIYRCRIADLLDEPDLSTHTASAADTLPTTGVPALGDLGRRTDDVQVTASKIWLWGQGVDLPDTLWTEAEAAGSFGWLVDHEPVADARRPGGRRVGRADVELVQAMSEAFTDADHRVGGGYACGTLLHYATTVVEPMLHGTYDERVGLDLFAASARLCNLAAFMCFDSGRQELGQEYFAMALRMAKIGDDQVLGGHILADMAMQSHYHGQPTESLALAQAGVDAARRTHSASTLARCLAIRARAMALAGDASGSDRSLNEAERILGHACCDDEPEWIKFFTIQQLATESMYVAADLSRPSDVRRHAENALVPVAAMQRRHVLASATLAGSYVTAARPADVDVEHACYILGGVVKILPSLTSTRARRAVDSVRRRLSAYASNPAVSQLEHDLQAATGCTV